MTHERHDNTTPKDEQRTPESLYAKLDAMHRYDCDAAATAGNTKCLYYFSKKDQPGLITPAKAGFKQCLGNALDIPDWRQVVYPEGGTPGDPEVPTDIIESFFCNPPYSPGSVEAFVIKTVEEMKKGAKITLLIPADTSTIYYTDYCMEYAAELTFIERRVIFCHENGTPIKGSPKFGSLVAHFDMEQTRKQGGGLLVNKMKWR